MDLRGYRPRPMLVTPAHPIATPKFPVIDAHNHLGETFGRGWINRPLSELLEAMDTIGVKALVDLDGGWGEDILSAHLDKLAFAAERFQVFGGVDWSQWPVKGDRFGEWAVERLRVQTRQGARGLKIWKPLGLQVRDQHGVRVSVDDERLDPVWAAAGELGLPVMVHVADPVAFFEPLDAVNERWEELSANPDWHFPSPEFPPFLSILEAFRQVVSRHPETTFIGAHVGCYAENLDWVGGMLDTCPNYYIDLSARIGELGRQPYRAREFFIRYSDRILFGCDAGIDQEIYRISYRFLETRDEYFNYSPGEIPGQGRWYIYGLGLPDEVLRKVYYQNAARILNIPILT